MVLGIGEQNLHLDLRALGLGNFWVVGHPQHSERYGLVEALWVRLLDFLFDPFQWVQFNPIWSSTAANPMITTYVGMTLLCTIICCSRPPPPCRAAQWGPKVKQTEKNTKPGHNLSEGACCLKCSMKVLRSAATLFGSFCCSDCL